MFLTFTKIKENLMSFQWTSTVDKEMIDLWDQGVSATKIGLVIGTTKGSVIGRHRRLTKNDIPHKRGKPVMDAHPAFDPVANVWFLEDGTEAKSIRELLAKLPNGSTVKDYIQRF